jgi:dihydrofolate synthase/folylpolyglutamate synthase
LLSKHKIVASRQAVTAGLREVRWPGRFELLNRQPVLVVDCAHNVNSVQRLRAALAEWFPRPPRRRLALIFGASADKDINGMLIAFLGAESATGYPPADKVIVSKSGHPRSAEPAQLADLVRGINPTCPVSIQPGLDSALTEALAWAGPDDLICITGSIFVVAQARWAWMRRHPETFAPDDWVFQDETASGQKCGPFYGQKCGPFYEPAAV